MNDPAAVALEISLGEDETFGRLHIELAAWCDFETWMDVQVERLRQQWLHLAAPGSCRARGATSSPQSVW